MKLLVNVKGKILEGKAPEIMNEKLTSAMYEATMFFEREVKKRTPEGVFGEKGGLKQSIIGEVIEKGSPVVKGVVVSAYSYAEVIEKGRTAGRAWPPEGALLRWIEVKLGQDEAQAKRLEFVIRRKIGQKGFPGAHMFERALDENMGEIQDIFDRAGFDIARELSES